MLLMIDNYDSFTFNLVQYFYGMSQEVEVYRNDAISVQEIKKKSPDYIVISPGPCTPKEAGISVDVIREFSGKVPILGVCLGHQSIGSAYGANIIKANEIMHGKLSKIRHNGKGIFGEPTNNAVYIMGISHVEFGPRGIRREFCLYDEVAIWKQIS